MKTARMSKVTEIIFSFFHQIERREKVLFKKFASTEQATQVFQSFLSPNQATRRQISSPIHPSSETSTKFRWHTQQKRTKTSQHKLRATMRNVSLMMCVWSSDSDVAPMNQKISYQSFCLIFREENKKKLKDLKTLSKNKLASISSTKLNYWRFYWNFY